MLSSVISFADTLLAGGRRIGRLALASLLAAAALVLAAAAVAWDVADAPVSLRSAALVGPALLYLGRRLLLVRWSRRTLRQLRLEQRFLHHSLDPERLRRMFHRPRHFWTHSRVWQGLRDAQDAREARWVSPRRLRRPLRTHLDVLAPPSMALDAVLLLAPVVLLLQAHGPADVVPAAVPVTAAVLAVVVEAGLGVLRVQHRRALAGFYDALCHWASVAPLAVDADDADRPYAHRPVYRTAAWFAPGPPDAPAGSAPSTA